MEKMGEYEAVNHFFIIFIRVRLLYRVTTPSTVTFQRHQPMTLPL